MTSHRLVCIKCKNTHTMEDLTLYCKKCGGILEYNLEIQKIKKISLKGQITFWRYKPFLPKVSKIVTLGEGGTPLQKAERLAKNLGINNLYLKNETQNPTNSFKDRSASLIISDATSRGYDNLVCATNGNHGASLAAYAAKENISCNLIVPKAIDIGKLAQMMIYNARIEEAENDIEEAIERSRNIAAETGWYQATTELNPLSIEGSKTISFELIEQFGVPDWIILAMGSGSTLHAIWKGFKEMEKMSLIDKKPRLIGVQAVGCAPITEAYIKGLEKPLRIKNGDTEASAIKVQNPIYGELALDALKQSNGNAITVEDHMMVDAGKLMARFEGIFAEPASAAPIASLRNLIDDGIIRKKESIVCLITSSGLKTDDILNTLNKHRKAPKIGTKLSTKETILKKISMKKTYGYEIWKTLGGDVTLGAVYQHLNDLENRGLILPQTLGKRKLFMITERGKRVLAALNELQVLL